MFWKSTAFARKNGCKLSSSLKKHKFILFAKPRGKFSAGFFVLYTLKQGVCIIYTAMARWLTLNR